MTISLVCGVQADVPTQAGNIYPRKLLEKLVERINEAGAKGRILGGLCPSPVRLSKHEVSHLVRGAQIDETGRVQVAIEVLTTPAGNTLLDWIASKQGLRVLPVGIGSVSEQGIVGDDYTIETMNVVPEDHTTTT